jgi:hypothetical protein
MRNLLIIWWVVTDLNRGPKDYESRKKQHFTKHCKTKQKVTTEFRYFAKHYNTMR